MCVASVTYLISNYATAFYILKYFLMYIFVSLLLDLGDDVRMCVVGLMTSKGGNQLQ